MTNGVQSGPVDGRGEVTRLLQEMREGDPKAAEELLARVYCELGSIAGRLMAREAPGHVLQPTALVHEAWLRLGGGTGQSFPTQPISSEIPCS